MEAIKRFPLVSVITPVYNGGKYIEELINSVQNQDYPSIEHIIIDDGSTDGTIDILKKYHHLCWWSHENRGQYPSLNEGLVHAKGEIVNIISADDLYVLPSAVSWVVDFWQAHPEYEIIYGGVIEIDENGNEFQVRTPLLLPIPKRALRYSCFIPHCSLFVSRKLIVENNIFFDEYLKNAGDWDWIIRLSRNTSKFGFVRHYLSKYRYHSNQTTSLMKNAAGRHNESVLVSKRYGTPPIIYFSILRILIISSLIKKSIWTLRKKGGLQLVKVIKDWFVRKWDR